MRQEVFLFLAGAGACFAAALALHLIKYLTQTL